MRTIDLNCDLGEGAGNDAELMPLISSANIACGAHAGDLDTIRKTIALARQHGVGIGAHPSFDDREHFGRRELQVSPEEIRRTVSVQIDALRGCGHVRHVKPHGALYNMAARDATTARAIAEAVYELDPRLVVFALSGSVLAQEAERLGLRVAHEVFADRSYAADGSLTPRSQPGALIEDEEAAVAQALGMIKNGLVKSVSDENVSVRSDTICLHGDNPRAVIFARRLRDALNAEGIRVAPFAQ